MARYLFMFDLFGRDLEYRAGCLAAQKDSWPT